MKQSQLFTRTRKDAPADETNQGTQYLIRAGFIDKMASGVYTMLPLGFKVLSRIEKIIASRMDALGAQRMLMPALVSKKNWETTGRWQGLDVLYKVKGKSGEEYALGATHEEAVTPVAQKFAFSYKDFPFAVYQIQTKFRDELRAKSGLLRGREFMMKDLYSFHTDQKECDEYYDRVKDAYFEIFKETGLAGVTYFTLASGGTFSKYSHEFQAATAAGEDIVYICSKCGLAINREIKEENPKCPECGSCDFEDKKAIEIGNIFKLGTKYSSAFEFVATGQDGSKLPVLMNCYGIGLTRLMGTVAQICSDGSGMIWPRAISPFDVHVVELASKDAESDARVSAATQKIILDLQNRGLEVLYDDRKDKSAGEKFKDSDLIGITWRVVVSARSLDKDSVEIKKRGNLESELVGIGNVGNFNFN